MKKTFVLFLVLALVGAGVFANGAKEQEKVVIRWGSVHTPDSITTRTGVRQQIATISFAT